MRRRSGQRRSSRCASHLISTRPCPARDRRRRSRLRSAHTRSECTSRLGHVLAQGLLRPPGCPWSYFGISLFVSFLVFLYCVLCCLKSSSLERSRHIIKSTGQRYGGVAAHQHPDIRAPPISEPLPPARGTRRAPPPPATQMHFHFTFF